MKRSTIALCIPAYNAAWCLPRLLLSAAQQEIPFDEVLVYNDCSTDNTSTVAKEFGATVIEGSINVGCSEGKNNLAKIATSEWIHFHDADDELYPNFTKLAHQWIERDHCPDVILFNYEWKDHSSKKLLSIRPFDRNRLEQDPISYAILEQINPFCGLYRKKSILEAGGYDIDPLVLYNEDVAFHIRLAAKGLRFSVEEEVSIINYRVEGSMSAANKKKCVAAHYHVLRKAAKEVGHKYAHELSKKLWFNAGVAASLDDMDIAYSCVKLASQLTGRIPIGQSTIFTALAVINPFLALRFREYFIRKFKPEFR